MIVSVLNVRRPGVDSVDLSDLTTAQILRRGYVTDPDGTERYEIQFAVNVAQPVVDAVKRRLSTATDVEETLYTQGVAALDADRNFRDVTAASLVSGADAIIANPALTQANMRSLAQGVKALTNQVESLSRQNIALIRLAQNLLDAPD